jgi:hypothetical protein
MNAGNSALSHQAVADYLGVFDSRTARRGRHYYADKAVLEIGVEEPGAVYKALVRGGDDYEVTLEYSNGDGGWEAFCTCPMAYDCKHAYAAILALQANAGNLQAWAPNKRKPGRATRKNIIPADFSAQLPSSPLADLIKKGLGRKLSQAECEYVRSAQAAFRACQGREMTASDLAVFSPDLRDYSWTPLQLWPSDQPPKDDLEFWQYIVYELRRRKGHFAECMLPATDTSRIEPVMRRMERDKQIVEWREKLRSHQPADRKEPVDFRFMIRGTNAFLQIKKARDPEFADVTSRQSTRYAYGEPGDGKELQPEAMLLWAVLRTASRCYDLTKLPLHNTEAREALNRVLRVPALESRVVNEKGEPLARPTDPLTYRLDEPSEGGENYTLRLALATGEPAPPIKATLSGTPALYLADNAIYQGPPAHRFEMSQSLAIPAPALESRAGLEFLQNSGIGVPARIATKVRPIVPKIRIKCALKSQPAREQMSLAVTAKTDKTEEFCGNSGWYAKSKSSGYYDPQPTSTLPEVGADGSIPLVDNSVKKLFPEILEPLKAKWEGYTSDWRVTVIKAFPDRFVSWLKTLPPEVEVLLDKELATLRDAPVSGTVQLDLEEAGVDWFDLRVALKVSDLELTKDEMKLLLNARGGFVRLGSKGWRRLQFNFSNEENERLAQLGLNAGDFSSQPQRLHALQLANPAARKLLPEQQVASIERRASEIKTRVAPAVPEEITASLRPYQVDGFHFLCYLSANRFGGVLADDMGLGKTLQALAWLGWLRKGEASEGITPAGKSALPSLIVCPKSVMDNWRTESARFYSGLKVRVWQGEPADQLEQARSESDLVVINYAQLRSLSPGIASYQWEAVILDEAQNIKNPDSQSAQASRALKANHRLALTGTPIENRLLDLWSIFSFVMPGVLGNRAHFIKTFNQQDDPFARQRLAARVRPFLLRRTKAQVARDLPDKIEEDIICELEGHQKTLYRAEFKAAQQKLLSISTQKELNEQRFNFLTSLLRLRQICCHPALVSGEFQNVESAKVIALMDMIESIIDEGHKVLIFSQFVTMLDILKPLIEERGWKQFYLAGDTENRGQLVEEFQTHEGGALFLISLKAGGFGLNLTAASYVFIFDPWWNPAVENQAIDRTHRIGQTSKVIAYRLLMKDSIEQKIRVLQKTKAALAQDVLGEERFSQSLTMDDLRFLFEE